MVGVYSRCRSNGLHMRGESLEDFSDLSEYCQDDCVGNRIEIYRESDVRRSFPVDSDGVQELKGGNKMHCSLQR